MLLSPEQFARLTEYAQYSSHKLLDMLAEFQPDGMFYKYLSNDLQTIDFDGFTHFINCYFGAELPADLIQQLFLSFANSSILPGGLFCFDIDFDYIDHAAGASERRPSALEDAINTVKNVFHGPRESLSHIYPGQSSSNYCQYGSNTHLNTLSQRANASAVAVAAAVASSHELPSLIDHAKRIPLKPLVCYLSLLEGAPPEDKLEFVFHVYDSDDNGYLDSKEVEGIIEQMMNVARYQQWDTIELEPILRQMMAEIDYDNDGIVSLEEWKRGGMTTIPLLVLLGFDTEMKEDGCHIWRLRHFSKPTYCNVCCNLLVGWGGKQGLACSLCKYTVHERCVRSAQNTCIHTYNSNPSKKDPVMFHHWIESNSTAKCVKCKNTVSIFQGKRCRWCKNLLHTKCVEQWPKECDFGSLTYHILPPINIVPTFLDRSQSQQQQYNSSGGSVYSNSTTTHSHYGSAPSTSITNTNLLQVTPLPPNSKIRPLLVLINPKSGGRQGERIYRKFQYLLNPRQVYDLCKDGPEIGLNLFKPIKNCNILVCGGDGTIGWVLEAMDKMDYEDNYRPPVAILPLGTGNDLSRCLKWGSGYESGDPLQKILQSVEKANQIYMDRWQITIEQTKKVDKGDPQPYTIINNYFSIGVDASIAHRFHVMREKYPEKFNSRMRNKLCTCKNLHEQIDILCDGETVDLGNGPNLEGIALLNIASIYGGSNLWGNSRKTSNSWHIPILFPQMANSSVQLQNRVQDIGDRLIEVVGLESAIQMGQIKAGVRAAARRLSQCSTPPCIIQIIHKNQVPMLIGNRKRSTWNLLKRQPTDDG
ncbi:diacylglycerol kinase accessory domain-containing protein [Ditylenchus destructor]|uniref:Diacylglycerol kinase n=1 Tax=Ditylenchus destructor TaxID=166010 RepID=A0AAD4R6U3_9BILA|nr:diacylglycerol kinase accessory domain-containing protein [Ditylenchus destructor]